MKKHPNTRARARTCDRSNLLTALTAYQQPQNRLDKLTRIV